jgi:hypothetical protein
LGPLRHTTLAPLTDPRVEAIRAELFRLKARPEDVGLVDGITVRDHGNGNVELDGSSRHPSHFNWFGSAAEILERLSGLPDGAGGPEKIRSEFA